MKREELRLGELAATYYPPAVDRGRPLLVCVPGGTYNRRYFDLDVTGHTGYSFASHATAQGYPVIAFDVLGTGESARPAAEVTLQDQADAIHVALRDWEHSDGPFIGVGHSMGGHVVMLQQAVHRTYRSLAILGTTNAEVAPLQLPPEMISAAGTSEGRAALTAQILAGMPKRYLEASRDDMLSWFHLDDVPKAVVDTDLATTLTCVPRAAAARSTVPGHATDEAAAIDVPVFLAFGEVDVAARPHTEPTFYPSSPDVTLYLLARSAHCHNMATTRHRLWDRLLAWAS